MKKFVIEEETPLQTWTRRLDEVLRTGNTSNSWNKSIDLFPNQWNKREMVTYCKVMIKAIEENCIYKLVFPKKSDETLKMKKVTTVEGVETSEIMELGQLGVEVDELVEKHKPKSVS
jgi:hypothetical protein